MTIVRHSIGLSVIQRKQSISHSAKATMRYYIATAIIISVINHGGLLFKLQSRQQILFSKLRPQIVRAVDNQWAVIIVIIIMLLDCVVFAIHYRIRVTAFIVLSAG